MGVKILFKNTVNTFKKKKAQFISIGVMIMLSSFLYTMMFYGMDSLRTPLQSFLETCNQEDFSIGMINGLTKSDIEALDEQEQSEIEDILAYDLGNIKKYDEEIYNKVIENRINEFENEYEEFELENRATKEINFKNNGVSNKITFFKEAENINLSFMEEGQKPVKDDEIAITRIYAKKNNLGIGDKLDIENKTYTITGFVLFPDKTLPVDNNEFNIDNGKVTLGLVNDIEYERLKGKESFYLAGVAKDDKYLDNFNDNVIKTYKDNPKLEYALGIVMTPFQMRSGIINTELKATGATTMGISVTISSIVVLIVLMIVYRIIKNEKTQIGVLKAIGYSSKEITKPYIIILSIISFPLLLLGYILGVYTAPLAGDLFLEFYLIPRGAVETNLGVLLAAIIVPYIVIIGLSSILIRKMLSSKVIDLLNANESTKVSKLVMLGSKALKNAKPQTKFKYSFILSNTNKFIVFFLGISFSSILIVMSLMISGFFEKMSVDYYESVDYMYEGTVDISKNLPQIGEEDEKFIGLFNVIYNDDNISMLGIEEDNNLHRLFDKSGKEITNKLGDGIIVNRGFEITYGAKIGDKINLYINGAEYQKEIIDIANDYTAAKVYIDINELSDIVLYQGEQSESYDESKVFFNGVYSKSELDKNDYAVVKNKQDVLEQTETMLGFVKIAVYGMVVSAVFIAALVLYILTSMTVEDNYYSISLLKVMGYSKKEVNGMMLNSYLIYAVISYLISMVVTVVAVNWGVRFLARNFYMIIPFEFELWHGAVGLIIIMVIFLIGTYAAKKKINKIALQEVLKYSN